VVYAEVVRALGRGPRRVADLLRLEGLPSGHPVSAVELVGILVGTGLAAVYSAPSAEQSASAERLNSLLDTDPDVGLNRGATLAVPATRSGVTLSAADFALYQDLRRGRSALPDSLADRFIARCRAMGCHPVLDGKSYENEAESRGALTREYQMKIDRFVPLWRSLGMI